MEAAARLPPRRGAQIASGARDHAGVHVAEAGEPHLLKGIGIATADEGGMIPPIGQVVKSLRDCGQPHWENKRLQFWRRRRDSNPR
jgi:hypothetical protein